MRERFMAAPYSAASALRSSPTFQAVTRSESFLGLGMRPSEAMRQTVGFEHDNKAITTPTLTFAESGR